MEYSHTLVNTQDVNSIHVMRDMIPSFIGPELPDRSVFSDETDLLPSLVLQLSAQASQIISLKMKLQEEKQHACELTQDLNHLLDQFNQINADATDHKRQHDEYLENLPWMSRPLPGLGG